LGAADCWLSADSRSCAFTRYEAVGWWSASTSSLLDQSHKMWVIGEVYAYLTRDTHNLSLVDSFAHIPIFLSEILQFQVEISLICNYLECILATKEIPTELRCWTIHAEEKSG
jgi:hypothetical protein